MNALVECEESQVVTIALRKRGIEAYSCDLQPCSGGHPEWHIQDDAIKVLYSRKWDLVISHPPCTYLANSGVRWRVEREEWEQIRQAAEFFNEFVDYGKAGNRIGIENPIQHKYARTYIVKYNQIIQPYQFGHMEQKATCLWLFNLPPLQQTNNVYDEMMRLPDNQRQRIHYLPPSKERKKLRSKTYPGIAQAIADQWINPAQQTLFG